MCCCSWPLLPHGPLASYCIVFNLVSLHQVTTRGRGVMTLLLFTVLAVIAFPTVTAQQKQQDLHSLEGPFTLPFWSVQGDAQVKEHFVRLVEDHQDMRGSLWNVVPNMFVHWEAVIYFRIHGVSTLGADGLAFWYTDRINKAGSLFGNDELFNGIGVVVDTYDNDGAGLHPFVMLLKNDGTKQFNHEHEHGVHKDADPGLGLELGGCTYHVRNMEGLASLRITYYNRRLTVEILRDASNGYTRCIDVSNVDLPTGHFFGFTAATGRLADNHDIHRFVLRGLDDQGKPQDLPSCGDGNVGRALSLVQEELAETRKGLDTLLMKGASGGSVPSQGDSAQLLTRMDELRKSLVASQESLSARLSQLDHAVSLLSRTVGQGTDTGESRSSSSPSLLTWVTCLMVICCCCSVMFSQFQAHQRRKHKFF